MATLFFVGDAAPVAQVTTITPSGTVTIGDTFTAVINAGGVVNVEIDGAGHGYEPGDTVQLAFSGGGSDTSAILEATLNAGGVTAVSVTAGVPVAVTSPMKRRV